VAISSEKIRNLLKKDEITRKGSSIRKCPKCGYERTQKDDDFISVTECPKCGVIYEREESSKAKRRHDAEEELLNVAEEEKHLEAQLLLVKKIPREKNERNEKERIQSQDENFSDSRSSVEGSQESNDGFGKAEENFYNQGCNAFDDYDYEKAVEKFTKAIQRNPAHAKALANRGLAYRKIKRSAEAMVDLKEAARLGSKVAKDDLLSIRNTNQVIWATALGIFALIIIISGWPDDKANKEIERQRIIAADQARIKVEQERSSFQEEYKREREKKRIHDLVYGDPLRDFNDSIWGHRSNRPSDDPMTRMEMESMAKKKAERAIENDRMIQPHRISPYDDPVTNIMPIPNIPAPKGAINVTTGEYYPPAAGGIIEPKTGTFLHDVGGGYVDTRTGQFIPKTGP
jgi:tetratricopeptide (TPR) repeat protein